MSIAVAANPPVQLTVRYRVLIGVMIIPICFAAVMAIDWLFFDETLLFYFRGTEYNDIAFSSLLLSFPHIVASLTTFADRDYLVAYKSRLIKGAIICLILAAVIPYFFGLKVAMVTMAFYTVYHNYMQQYGISLMMMRQPPTLDYQIMRWTTLGGAGIGYIYALIPGIAIVHDNIEILAYLSAPLMILAVIAMVRFIRTNLANPDHTRIGLWYFSLNMFVITLCYIMLMTDYPLLAIITSRIVHDYTAFWIYMVHDQNRNRDKIHNPLYWLPKKLGIPPIVACIPIALAISSILIGGSESMYTLVVVVAFCNFMHYYLEGHMWKRGTLHRQNAPFSY